MRLGRFFLGRGFFSAVIVAISVIAAAAYTAAARSVTFRCACGKAEGADNCRNNGKTVKNSLFFILTS